ncbi:MAG: ATP-binding cassette domain-containing protein [Planctomycetota bacterium]
MDLIRLKNVSKQYIGIRGIQGKLALKELTVNIPKGGIHFVIGPEGAGKSTFLHLISALDCCTSGEIWFEDECISNHSFNELTFFRKQKIGLLFQALSLTDGLSALENVLVPIIPDGITPIDVENARILLNQVGLGENLLFLPLELTSGEQQRTALARAMVNHPQLIIADEPAGELDAHEAEELFDYIRKLNKEFGVTFIIASRSTKFAKKNDLIYKLYEGSLLPEESEGRSIQTSSESSSEDTSKTSTKPSSETQTDIVAFTALTSEEFLKPKISENNEATDVDLPIISESPRSQPKEENTSNS